MKNSHQFILLFALAAGIRLLPHLPNVAPITAVALIGGTFLTRRSALVLPVLVSLVTDLFLGFHNVMFWVYGSYLVIALLASHLKTARWLSVAGYSLVASWIFFIVTNFGVWLVSGMYAPTSMGLMQSYVMGLPFFRNALIGDLLFSIALVVVMKTVAQREYSAISSPRSVSVTSLTKVG